MSTKHLSCVSILASLYTTAASEERNRRDQRKYWIAIARPAIRLPGGFFSKSRTKTASATPHITQKLLPGRVAGNQ
jgi:hypothetical protein